MCIGMIWNDYVPTLASEAQMNANMPYMECLGFVSLAKANIRKWATNMSRQDVRLAVPSHVCRLS